MCQVIFIRIGYENEFVIVGVRFSRSGQEPQCHQLKDLKAKPPLNSFA